MAAELFSSHSMPALGSLGGLFGFFNTDTEGGPIKYGLVGNVSGATGAVSLQSQRVDGTATAYNMIFQQNGGSVYIATTSGVSGGGALQVNGNININGVFQINGTTIGGGGGSGVTGSGTSGYHSKWTSASSLGNSIIFDNGTNVGVNTTSPNDYVDGESGMAILQSTNGRAVLTLAGTRVDADEALGRLSFTNSNATTAGSKRLAHISGYRGTTNNSAYLEFATANDAIGVRRMVISQTGNVGIGTSNPDARLVVQWDKSTRFAGQAIYDSQAFNVSNHGGTVTFGGTFNSAGAFTEWSGIGGMKSNTTDGNVSGDINFYTRLNSSAMTERMRITSDGNVLIGTSTDAGYKFDVNGGTRIQGNLRLDGSSVNSPTLTIWGVTNSIINMGDNTSATTDVGIIQIRNGGTPVIQLDAGSGTNSYFNTGGGLLVNTIADAGAGYKLQVNGSILMTYANFFNFRGSSPAGDVLVDNSGSTLRITGNVTVAGSVTATGGFFDTSDSRLKIVITDNHIAKGIEKVAAKFYVKNGKRELGYFAQDLQEILPSAVGEATDGFLTLSYSQVHTAKIAVIEDEVTILKNRVSDLESKLLKYEA